MIDILFVDSFYSRLSAKQLILLFINLCLMDDFRPYKPTTSGIHLCCRILVKFSTTFRVFYLGYDLY